MPSGNNVCKMFVIVFSSPQSQQVWLEWESGDCWDEFCKLCLFGNLMKAFLNEKNKKLDEVIIK